MPPCQPAMSSTKAIICWRRPITPFRFGSRVEKAASCGGGSWAPRDRVARERAGCGVALAISWNNAMTECSALIEVLGAARILPGDGWAQRVAEGRGLQTFEGFLALVRQQVLARAALTDAGYGLQAEARPPVAGLVDLALPLAQALGRLAAALSRLASVLRAFARRPGKPARAQLAPAARRGNPRAGAARRSTAYGVEPPVARPR